MLSSLGGLPSHPLLVHIPVAFIPLATVGVIVLALRPSAVRTFGPLVAAIAGVGFVGAIIAASTGEELEEQFESSGQTISGTLADHTEMGESVRLIAGIFFLLTLGWVLFTWWRARAGEEAATAKVRKPRTVALVFAVLSVIAGIGATASVIQTGHSGAKSVWQESDS